MKLDVYCSFKEPPLRFPNDIRIPSRKFIEEFEVDPDQRLIFLKYQVFEQMMCPYRIHFYWTGIYGTFILDAYMKFRYIQPHGLRYVEVRENLRHRCNVWCEEEFIVPPADFVEKMEPFEVPKPKSCSIM